jgi:mannose-6-phosphate isomerase-like protein (cupin superfamily)
VGAGRRVDGHPHRPDNGGGADRTGGPGELASRDTDRLVVVTEGRLNTEMAARPGLAPAEAVIVIPAGVPHRIWSSSSAPVRYLDIDLQTPAAYAKLATAE